MDAGTHALDILTGRVYPLKLGFVGVVKRPQRDIDSEKCMTDALENEAEFFKHYMQYRISRTRTEQTTSPKRLTWFVLSFFSSESRRSGEEYFLFRASKRLWQSHEICENPSAKQ
jgi:Dynamin central region